MGLAFARSSSRQIVVASALAGLLVAPTTPAAHSAEVAAEGTIDVIVAFDDDASATNVRNARRAVIKDGGRSCTTTTRC